MAIHKIIIQGGGLHARVVLDCLLALGHNVVAFCDPNTNGKLYGVIGQKEYDPLYEPEAYAVVAIGDNSIRKNVVETTRHSFINVVHPSVIFSAFATIGLGNMILPGAIVQAQAKIGNHVIVNTGSQVNHDCILGDFVHLAQGAILCGNVEVGEGSCIGAGATVMRGKKIGKWAVIGEGSVVVDDVPDFTLVDGNPARAIKNLQL